MDQQNQQQPVQQHQQMASQQIAQQQPHAQQPAHQLPTQPHQDTKDNEQIHNPYQQLAQGSNYLPSQQQNPGPSGDQQIMAQQHSVPSAQMLHQVPRNNGAFEQNPQPQYEIPADQQQQPASNPMGSMPQGNMLGAGGLAPEVLQQLLDQLKQSSQQQQMPQQNQPLEQATPHQQFQQTKNYLPSNLNQGAQFEYKQEQPNNYRPPTQQPPQNQAASTGNQLEQMLGSLTQQFAASGQGNLQPAHQPMQQHQAPQSNPQIGQIVGLLSELQQNLTTISQMQKRQAQPSSQGEERFANNPEQSNYQQPQQPPPAVRMQQPPVQQNNSNSQSQQQQNGPQGHFIKFFVGGILYSAKELDVEKYFQQFGQVVDVAIMRDKKTGRSRGFAFVTFKENTAERVQILKQNLLTPPPSHPHVIQGRAIEVREGDGNKPADSFLGKTGTAPEPPRNVSHHQPLPPQQPASNQQNQSRGRRENSRERGGDKGQRRLRSRSRDRSEQSHQPVAQNSQQRSSANSGQPPPFDHGKRKETETVRLEKSGGTKDKVFVGGLDYQLTDDQFVAHFEEFGKVKEAQIVRDPVTNASRGFGFVTFINENVARRLITELQKCDLNGRMVDLRTAEPKLSEKIAIINKSFHEQSYATMGQGQGNNSNNQGNQGNFNQGQSQNKPKDNFESDKRKSRDNLGANSQKPSGNSGGNGSGSNRDRSKNPSKGNNQQPMGDQGRNRPNQSRGMQQQDQQLGGGQMGLQIDRPFSHFVDNQYGQTSGQNQGDEYRGNNYSDSRYNSKQGGSSEGQGKSRQQGHPLIQDAMSKGSTTTGYSRPPPSGQQSLGMPKSSENSGSGGNKLDMDKPLFASNDNFMGNYSVPRNNQPAQRGGNQSEGIRADMSLASMQKTTGDQRINKPSNSSQQKGTKRE